MDPAYERAARDLIRYMQSPEVRYAIEAINTARDKQQDIERARKRLDEIAESRSGAREYGIGLVDPKLLTRADDARRVAAIYGLTTLVQALERHVNVYRNGVEALLRVLDNDAVRVVARTLEAAAKSGTATPSTSDLDVHALEQVVDSGILDDLDLDAFDATVSGIDALDEFLEQGSSRLVAEWALDRRRARRLFLVIVFIAWAIALTKADEIETGPLAHLDTILTILGLGSPEVAKRARQKFDEHFPPIDPDAEQSANDPSIEI